MCHLSVNYHDDGLLCCQALYKKSLYTQCQCYNHNNDLVLCVQVNATMNITMIYKMLVCNARGQVTFGHSTNTGNFQYTLSTENK